MQRVLLNEKSHDEIIKELDSQDPDQMDYKQILDLIT